MSRGDEAPAPIRITGEDIRSAIEAYVALAPPWSTRLEDEPDEAAVPLVRQRTHREEPAIRALSTWPADVRGARAPAGGSSKVICAGAVCVGEAGAARGERPRPQPLEQVYAAARAGR